MICRLCLIDLNSENSVALYNATGSYDDPQLLKLIEKYLYLDITWCDEISNTICQDCSKHLKEFDKYCTYIREQQIMLNQRVPVVADYQKVTENFDTSLNVVPMEINIKTEPEENDAPVATQMNCVAKEDVLTMGARLKCEPVEDVATKEKENKYVTEQDVPTPETQPKCESEEDVAKKEMQSKCVAEEDVPTLGTQLKCEPEEAEFTEMTLMSSTVSNHSAYRNWSSSLYQQNISDSFNGSLETRNIEDSSISHDFMSDKQGQFIPDAIAIKLLHPVQEIYKSFLLGNPLKDMDRIIIAEAVIEECLKNKPEKGLRCKEFGKLADNIVEVFPSEDVSTYYLWHTSRRPASGKLFYAYIRQLATSGKSKVKKKSKTKKIPMTSTERSRKYRASKYVNPKNKSKVRKASTNFDDTLEFDDSQLSVDPIEDYAPEEDGAMDMHWQCLSEDDVLSRNKMETKKKPMSSAERTRKHRARKYHINHMENWNISCSADFDDPLEYDTQFMDDSVTNPLEEGVSMEFQQKYLSEEDVPTRTKKVKKNKKKPMTSTERSRVYRARKYQLFNMENMKISSSASIDCTLESVVNAAWL